MIIALSHQKGGVGKSTIAWNIAIALQQKKHNVEVIDLDAQTTLFFANEIRKGKEGLKALTLKRFEKLDELKEYIQSDSEDRVSIIDLGGFDSDISRVVIYSADLVITPVSDRYAELFGIKSFEKILTDISKISGDKVKVGVLLNRINPVKSNLSELKSFISSSEYFTLFDTVLRTREDLNKSLGAGKNVIEYNKKGKASKEIRSLVKEIEIMIESA